MIKSLIFKELKAIITGPKFTATFAVCAILILLSIFIGIRDYQALTAEYEAGLELTEQRHQDQSQWMFFQSQAYRAPDPMHIFVSGVNYDIGRRSQIQSSQPVKLLHSVYTDDPIFAVFRFIDLNFIFLIVLSLFAILFTYDAVNGEKERGTLRLTFANPVPRVHYILAKIVGSWLGLVIPLLVPLLLGLLLVMLYRIPMTSAHWIKVIVFLGISLLYFTFYIVLGILVSTLTRRSAVSFLILLVIWVTFSLIIPRAGVAVAGKVVSVPTAAEIDGQIESYSKERWDQHLEESIEMSRQRQAQMASLSEDEREAYRDAHMWEWMEESNTSREAVQQDINEMTRRLREDLQNKRAVQERLALALSRFSPASAYQLAAMNLANTDVGMKTFYEDAMQHYHEQLMAFTQKKQKEDGGMGGIQIAINEDGEQEVSLNNRQSTALDLSDMPRFSQPDKTIGEAVHTAIPDGGLLILFTLLAMAGGFVGFLRYDVR